MVKEYSVEYRNIKGYCLSDIFNRIRKHRPHGMRAVFDTVIGSSERIPSKELGKFLLAEILVFLLVGAALDSSVYDFS